jgi:hypothetical protein
MSFFDPVYQNDGLQMNNDESDSELSGNDLSSRQKFRNRTKDESNETLDAVPMVDSLIENDHNEISDQDPSSDVRITKKKFFFSLNMRFQLDFHNKDC